MRDRVITDSTFSHLVHVAVERVDVAAWLGSMTSDEFRRCCPGEHLAAGVSSTDDGGRLIVSAETIGTDVLVHRYRRELAGARRCRLASTSDAVGPGGHAVARVVWEVGVEAFDAGTCEYVNRLVVSTADARLGLTDAAAVAHAKRETPLLAASLERYARGAART